MKKKERFKELKKKKAIEINQLFYAQTLGKEPYQRLTTLIQLNYQQTQWKAETNEEKELVINNFKELCKHSNNKHSNAEQLIKLLIKLLDTIIKDQNSKNTPPPSKPKSRARDKFGFSQQELINITRS